MAWVRLYDERGYLERVQVPNRLHGSGGTTFYIKHAKKGGGNGVVFEAVNESLRATPTCAVKILKRQDENRLDRFQNEIRIQKSLKHTNIAQLFDSNSFSEHGYEIPWAAMELGGSNLRDEVQTNGRLSPEQLLPLADAMCLALDHVHKQGIIHRDVKPDNFVFANDDGILMIDFGIAKYIGEDVSGRAMDQFTLNQEFVGPQFYSSPELIEYSRNKDCLVDYRSDIFQLAKVIWFIATGRISAGVISRRGCPLAGSLHAILLPCLSDEPDDRPSSVEELRTQLATLGRA